MDTEVSKVVESAATPRPPAAGKGRRKGVPNKFTKALKDMILGALDDAGGQAYLVMQAKKNPSVFMTLLGKVLPLQVTGENGNPIQSKTKTTVALDFDAVTAQFEKIIAERDKR